MGGLVEREEREGARERYGEAMDRAGEMLLPGNSRHIEDRQQQDF